MKNSIKNMTSIIMTIAAIVMLFVGKFGGVFLESKEDAISLKSRETIAPVRPMFLSAEDDVANEKYSMVLVDGASPVVGTGSTVAYLIPVEKFINDKNKLS
jgi:hypothetical protein